MSTNLGLCHWAEDDEAVVVAAVVFAAVEGFEAVVVAKCPTAIFSMASLKRPAGKYQCPLFPFFIWRCTCFPLGLISHPFSPRNHISPVLHRMTASIRRRASMPRRAGTSEPLITTARYAHKCFLPSVSSIPIGTTMPSRDICAPSPTPWTVRGLASWKTVALCPRACAHLPAWTAQRSPHKPPFAPVSGSNHGSPSGSSSQA